MESSIMNGMCRCCASEGVFKDVKTSYTWMGEEEVYADMLKDCFDINLSTSDTIEDGGICEVCITQLRNASNFKKQVLNTEEQFKKHALNKLFKPNIVKVEVNADDDDNDSDDNVLSGEEGYSGPEYEVPIKTESDDPKPKKRAAASKATTSRAKKAKTDSGESSTKRLQAGKVKKEENPIKCKSKPLQEIKKHRVNITEVMRWSNATPIRRCGDTGYVCCYCNDSYRLPAELKKHTLDTHKDIKEAYFMKLNIIRYVVRLDITYLQCKICNQNIDTLEQLIKHLMVDHQKILYTDIENHIIPLKFTTEKLECCICGKIFSKFKMLVEHMNTHYRNYICNVCDVGFPYEIGLKTHIDYSHNTGTFKCDNCPLIFSTNSKKKVHEKTAHSLKKKLHKCGYCHETFNDLRTKEAHLATTHGLELPTSKCDACNKVYKTRKLLNIHIKRDHLMERRHQCPECDKSFFESSVLKTHMAKHTGIRSLKCSVCSKTFGRINSLQEHMKIHDDVRRFKCEHCGQAFVQKSSWKGHMKSKHFEIV